MALREEEDWWGGGFGGGAWEGESCTRGCGWGWGRVVVVRRWCWWEGWEEVRRRGDEDGGLLGLLVVREEVEGGEVGLQVEEVGEAVVVLRGGGGEGGEGEGAPAFASAGPAGRWDAWR